MMISNFKTFVESYEVAKDTLTMTKLMEMAHLLKEGFEYFLNVDGEVSPVSREEFLRYSMSKTSISKDSNKRFNIDMNGNEVVGVFADVDVDIDTKDVVIDADVLNAEAATLGQTAV